MPSRNSIHVVPRSTDSRTREQESETAGHLLPSAAPEPCIKALDGGISYVLKALQLLEPIWHWSNPVFSTEMEVGKQHRLRHQSYMKMPEAGTR